MTKLIQKQRDNIRHDKTTIIYKNMIAKNV